MLTPVDGHSTMHIQGALTAFGELLMTITKKQRALTWEKYRVRGAGRIGGRTWWMGVIKVLCVPAWNYQRIKHIT